MAKLMAAQSRHSSVVDLCSELLASGPQAEAHVLRGTARHHLQQREAAQEDLAAAVGLGAPEKQLEGLQRALRCKEGEVEICASRKRS